MNKNKTNKRNDSGVSTQYIDVRYGMTFKCAMSFALLSLN